MIKLKYTYIIFFLLCYNTAVSQIKKDIQVSMKNTIPKEKIVISLNNNVLIAGETIYYKVLCLESGTNKLSGISKIAYVDLFGNNDLKLFKHKIKISNSVGFGQFFIPANIKTGHYKLIGFTQWMKNNDTNPFFQKDLYIINPYVSSSNSSIDTLDYNNTSDVQIQKNESLDLSIDESRNIVLKTNSNKYETRSKVVLNINNLIGTTGYGNYSLSVREFDGVSIGNENKVELKPVTKTNNAFYLPEIRGEILSGRVVLKENNSFQPNKIVALSIIGNNNVFKNVITDESGRFFFNIKEAYTSSKCTLQVLDSEKENYDIILDDKSFEDYNTLQFKNTFLNPDIEDWLIRRSVTNQIENAYSELKTDSIVYQAPIIPFYGKPTTTYNLDDYKRFSTVRETFVEVIEGIGIRKNKDQYSFKIYYREEYENNTFDKYRPLILVDGLLIQESDNEYLVDYNSYKIDTVNFLQGIYFNGPSIFDGILDIRTKKEDFYLPNSIEGLINIDMDVPIEKRKYYTPIYSNKNKDLKRIPDYRSQLIWKPNIVLDSDSKTIEFYTSDIEGIYNVVLEGYTSNGNYIKTKTFFEVKKQ